MKLPFSQAGSAPIIALCPAPTDSPFQRPLQSVQGAETTIAPL